MKELSLNILDIAENSVKAGASLTEILVLESGETLTLTITDNGSGMTKEILNSVTDPFCTTRTTRKVGMGIPLLKLEAEMTGGSLAIESRHFEEYPENHGTKVTAVFYKNHIDLIKNKCYKRIIRTKTPKIEKSSVFKRFEFPRLYKIFILYNYTYIQKHSPASVSLPIPSFL